MNLDITQTITDFISEEEIKNERKIHFFRMMILAIMAVMMIISRLLIGEAAHETFIVITPASLIYFLLGFLLQLL